MHAGHAMPRESKAQKRARAVQVTDRLEAIPGQPASLLNLPSGCAFSTRCSKVFEKCVEVPQFRADATGHGAACFLVGDL